MARTKGSGNNINNTPVTKVTFSKSGKGNNTTRVNIPKSWMDALGVTEENPNIKKTFQDGKIIIEKE